MKNISLLTIALLFSLTSHSALARNTVSEFSITEAMALEQAKTKVGNEVRFYFGNQQHSKPLKNWGEVSTNKKTNAFNKSDQAACTQAFLSALITLRNRALKEGGNAVINIESNYKGNVKSSATMFECGAGNILAGVALNGTIVKLP